MDCYNPKLYSNRCTAYLYLHEFESALQDAKKCVSLDPDWGKGHVQMGSCYTSLHQYKEAIEEYKKGRTRHTFSYKQPFLSLTMLQ